ncbi:endonuclease domain-containing protein [Paraburkholderia sp. A2RO-4L]|uniref:endonuclease domain-containing protein n=1 Tax=Paraburkholderia sp. A2RO-4L TaxID=3028374 RepID=UPI003DA93369
MIVKRRSVHWMTRDSSQTCKHCDGSLVAVRKGASYCSASCRAAAAKKRRKIRTGQFVRLSRHCLECGTSFRALCERNVYCSGTCGRTAYKRAAKAKRRVVPCVVCGNQFAPNSSRHKTCSDICRKQQDRNVRLARHYGLSGDAFQRILKAQGGCAVCGTAETERWAVDHDHSCCSGRYSCGKCVRGILCFPCNKALGLFKDSSALLARAIVYLQGKQQ